MCGSTETDPTAMNNDQAEYLLFNKFDDRYILMDTQHVDNLDYTELRKMVVRDKSTGFYYAALYEEPLTEQEYDLNRFEETVMLDRVIPQIVEMIDWAYVGDET